MRWLALVSLSLAACADPHTSFVELSGLSVQVLLSPQVDSDDDATQPTHVNVAIGYDFQASDTCATFDIGGAFNGFDLELFSPGGMQNLDCFGAGLATTLRLAHDEAAHLELHDHQGNTIVAEFPAGAARVAWSTTGWTFARGQHVALDWSSASELSSFSTSDVFISFRLSDGQEFYRIPADALTSSQVLFTVPQSLPTGDGFLEVSMGPGLRPHFPVAATSCIGAGECTMTGFRSYPHIATITEVTAL
jgi:hypothetical protein